MQNSVFTWFMFRITIGIVIKNVNRCRHVTHLKKGTNSSRSVCHASFTLTAGLHQVISGAFKLAEHCSPGARLSSLFVHASLSSNSPVSYSRFPDPACSRLRSLLRPRCFAWRSKTLLKWIMNCQLHNVMTYCIANFISISIVLHIASITSYR